MTTKRLLLACMILAVASEAVAEEAPCARERAAMVETIRDYVRRDASVVPQGLSERVMKVVGETLRHRFMPDGNCAIGYVDGPVRIGHDSTISQPYIVALMTELAAVAPEHTVLEIGTGSGYQAAILARLARQVCTVEIVEPLAMTSARALNELGYDNVRVRVGDGYQGWPECGPFDAIVVTAALGHVPPPLLAQLKVGGRLVMPVGPANAVQLLTVAEKVSADEIKLRSVSLVRFVPFVRPPK